MTHRLNATDTATHIANSIVANCDAYHARHIDYAIWHQRQDDLWRAAEAKGPKCLDLTRRFIGRAVPNSFATD